MLLVCAGFASHALADALRRRDVVAIVAAMTIVGLAAARVVRATRRDPDGRDAYHQLEQIEDEP